MKNTLQALNQKEKLMEWSRQVKACRNSGMTVTAWCQEHGISASTYYHRQRKVYEVVSANQEVRFAQVPVMPEHTSNSAVASVQYGDANIEVYQGADSKTLRTIFEALKSC